MSIIHSVEETQEYIALARGGRKSVGLVPTMGYFHRGHQSIMARAREENDLVVVSLFVNPTQFGPSEDLAAYPRDLDRDASMAREVGVDVIFNPSVDEMYPDGYSTYVNVEGITEGLCGAARPGHFRGVATVVLKLLNIVQPDRVYFGQKDYQQLKVIERMVADLNVPVEVVGMPTVREDDGLAMSSRNTYLGPDERRAALILSKALHRAQELMREGVVSTDEMYRRIVEFISEEPLAQIDYVAVVAPETLECMPEIGGQALVALAVRIGKTRLIDNSVVTR